MKLRLTFRQLLPVALISALVAVIYALYRLIFPPTPPEIIRITAAYPNTDELKLQDAGGDSATTFRVKAGKTINWLVNTTDVTDITIIKKKPASENVFKPDPSRIGSSRNWKGIVDPGARGKTEDYYIDWVDTLGKTHRYDPKIQVMS